MRDTDELEALVAQLQDEIMGLTRELAEKEAQVEWLSAKASKCTCNPSLD